MHHGCRLPSKEGMDRVGPERRRKLICAGHDDYCTRLVDSDVGGAGGTIKPSP
jgi:hypothetical protein